MSRRVMPFQQSCHGNDVEWVCLSCDQIICAVCEASPGELVGTCAECFNTEED